ncbi:DUF4189 domain-containing protein [Roseomonas marmotae]|uniref:DUF4189 domain-containing protein n=1 Tax=Roseomonas marmotae TaxID=2768161 RepID=A0ABS3KCP1_9PROT|nr:DUF4189 domain-containing protein [Roseomonas marmotae]MBO1075238.1 DUF4189 domain-containing protein [Roseomonas marmotae]QTI79657.1 DUF4189 domain-containing protein [Roseomonas marmotae]
MSLGLFLLASPPAGAAPAPPDSQHCQRQCGAVLPRRADHPREVQICLMRCQALEQSQAVTRKPQPRRPQASQPAGKPEEPGGAGHGAIYLAPAPLPDAGMSAGMADRNLAHAMAEQQCMARQGAPCRLALEFSDRCGAVAQGVVSKAMVLTADPSTFTVMAATAGAGATRAQAERSALSACRQRFRGTCRIARSLCAG